MKTLLEANIGEIVKIREDNIPTEFIVIQKGDPFLNNARYENGVYILPKDIPSPTYVGFRHGVTLLRKDIHSVGKYDSKNNDYANSEIRKWCNGTYLNTIQKDIRNQIMTVKIPYRVGNTGSIVSSGMNGLSCQAFILSAAEVNYKDNYIPNEGAVFSYFKGGGNSRRIANLNGSPNYWWLRSPNTRWYDDAHCVNRSGDVSGYGYIDQYSFGRRPVIVLPESLSIDHEGNVMV